MKIGIGSTNLAKIEAVQRVFSENDEIISVRVPSGVSDQPFSDEETIEGAIQRAKKALETTNADLGIGLEGGVTETPYGLMLCNWGALYSKTDHSPIIAGGARILLPDEISERLRTGEELGPIMDDYCMRENIRHHEGAIGIFTNGLITRGEMFSHVVRMLKGQFIYRMNG
ncbi:DUF84 family protein [Fervidibacillus halotolerans]|uniref:inosine/xanthosine triphosphatase n=1 Tax=Fervidibacillus halotolerans TaxID=2980027 RepID=A0A9E8LYS0_9BACI|nr:DUF84 family protein [Fervidibacillus halotolerans]WAA11750.1 DUF84 family protein [Fervidibacillus halotolerans]